MSDFRGSINFWMDSSATLERSILTGRERFSISGGVKSIFLLTESALALGLRGGKENRSKESAECALWLWLRGARELGNVGGKVCSDLPVSCCDIKKIDAFNAINLDFYG